MKCKAKFGQPLLEVGQHLPCVDRALETHHEVVGIAHDRDSTARVPTTPLMNPEVEDVMQEDVGQQRANARPLRCPPVSLVPFTALENASFKPHPDEPEDPRVSDSVRQHSQQPLVVNRVEEAANISIEHPPYPLTHDRRMQ